MPKNYYKSKEAYLLPAAKAPLYRKVGKCLPGCAEGTTRDSPGNALKTYLVSSAANGGLRDGGSIRFDLRKKAFFLRFLDFQGALRTPWKRAKKAEKGDFGPHPEMAARHPLSSHLLYTPICGSPMATRLEGTFECKTRLENADEIAGLDGPGS